MCIRDRSDKPDVTIVTYGILINEAITAADLLKQQGYQVDLWKVNEISAKTEQLCSGLVSSFASHVAVLEDVVQNGSFSEAILRAAEQAEHTCQVHCYNVGNQFLPHGSVREIYQLC